MNILEIEMKEEYLKKISIKYHIDDFEDLDDKSIEILFDLYKNNKLDDTMVLTGLCYNYIGFYYEIIKPSEKELKKYFLLAFEHGCYDAALNLGFRYCLKKKYDKMRHYFMLAYEKGFTIAICHLAYCYHKINDHIAMTDILLLAIKKGNTDAMNALAHYYAKQGDDDKMTEYLLLSIEQGNTTAMNRLAHIYYQEGNYQEMIKYYSLSATQGDLTAMVKLAYYYFKTSNQDLMTKYLLLAFKQKKSFDDLLIKKIILMIPNAKLLISLHQAILHKSWKLKRRMKRLNNLSNHSS